MAEVFVTPQVSVTQEITPGSAIVTQDVLVQPTATTIELLVPGLTGPRGPSGPAATVGEQYFYAGPISSIGQAHTLGRIPAVSVLLNNELVGISISATPTSVAIEFPSPAYNVRIILT